MGWIPDELIAALRKSHELAIFIRVATEPDPLCVWMGINDIPAEIADVDIGGQIYKGGLRLANVPELEVLVNGVADRATFQLSGVDAATAAVLEPIEVRGLAVHVGITALDERYQPVSSIIPLISGMASFTTEECGPVTGRDIPTVTMGLSVSFGSITRSSPSYSMWSPPQFLAEHPTDSFCNNTPRYNRGVAPSWPRF